MGVGGEGGAGQPGGGIAAAGEDRPELSFGRAVTPLSARLATLASVSKNSNRCAPKSVATNGTMNSTRTTGTLLALAHPRKYRRAAVS